MSNSESRQATINGKNVEIVKLDGLDVLVKEDGVTRWTKATNVVFVTTDA